MTKEIDYSVKNRKKSFIKLIKRPALPLAKKALMYVGAICVALVVACLFIIFMGVNPFAYFGKVVASCFNNTINIRGLIRILSPLIITSLGVAIAFKMKFWNIGAEGQFIIGAICSAAVGLACGNMPQFVALLLMFLAGAIGAGIYALFTAVLKIKFGTNETLMTLMLNYIALYLLTYLDSNSYFRDPTSTRPSFAILPESAWLYNLKLGSSFSIDIAIVVAIIFVVIMFFYLKYSKQGFEISVVGDSLNTAKYAGMKTNKIILRTIFLSGAIIGVAGMLKVSGEGASHMLSTNITGGVGWTAIIVAWLSKLNPLGILMTSTLLGILQKGSSVAQSAFGISTAVSDIIQAIILFTVLMCDFFINYKIKFDHESKDEKTAKLQLEQAEKANESNLPTDKNVGELPLVNSIESASAN
ncbi:MAG: ABC transporter permease, partial [Clostridia bacterium]